MNYEFARSLIVWTGWPVLVIGSLWTLNQAVVFYQAVHKSAYGKLVLLTATGWLITMYCLGIVSTWFLYADPYAAVWVVMPVFLVWAITMVIIVSIMLRWNKMAIALNDLYLRLEHLVEDRTAELESARKKVLNLNLVLEERVLRMTRELEAQFREAQKTNQLLADRDLKMKRLKDEIDTLRGTAGSSSKEQG